MGCVLATPEIYSHCPYPNVKCTGKEVRYGMMYGTMHVDLPNGGTLKIEKDTFSSDDSIYFRRKHGIVSIDADYFLKGHDYRRSGDKISGPIMVKGVQGTIENLRMWKLHNRTYDGLFGLDTTEAILTFDHVTIELHGNVIKNDYFKTTLWSVLKINGVAKELGLQFCNKPVDLLIEHLCAHRTLT